MSKPLGLILWYDTWNSVLEVLEQTERPLPNRLVIPEFHVSQKLQKWLQNSHNGFCRFGTSH